MKINVELLVFNLCSIVVLTSAQNPYQNQKASTNRNRSSNHNRQNNEPVEQGRTLGLIRPLLGLGLSSIVRPFTSFGYDAPILPADSSSSAGAQADPYYGGYGGYNPNFYGGYNYYGGYPIYRPSYAGYPFFGYRRPVYPGYFGGYPQNNGYYSGQRPLYSNSRPSSSGQRPAATAPSRPITTNPSVGSGTSLNSAQAAQVANLLGQLLGQQLRPLVNQGAASPANDTPGIAPSYLEDKRYRGRNY